MILLSHPLGNQNVRAALRGFKDAGLLDAFSTGIASFPGSFLYKLSSTIKPLHEINKRSFDADLRPLTHTRPAMELARLGAIKAGLSSLIAHEKGMLSIDKVCHDIDVNTAGLIKKHKVKNLKAVYAYEDIALQTFRQAKTEGLTTLYDLPIGYWRAARRLMQSEIDNRPEWASTMVGFRDSAAKLQRKDDEIALADHIFVASSFTAKTLQDFPGNLPDITVIPYGFPPVFIDKKYNLDPAKPLKVLFVGGLSQRKGIANLFEAAQHFGAAIELTLVGRKAAGVECKPLDEGLHKCNYIPGLPHNKILELMRTQDVFVFPSLFEGFGLVITEAMSQGLPVITTERTIGPDIIRDGENGWLINAGSTESLIQSLQNIIDDREQLKKCGIAAVKTAMMRPWAKYSEDTATAVLNIINQKINK